MKLLPLALLLSFTACFDFTPTRQAGIGGRCGDLDHYCDDDLTCQGDVCIRKDGSNEGEACSADITCASGLVCNSGQCGSKCALTNCGGHGECVIDYNGDAACSCDPGYQVESGFCAGLLDVPCGDAQVCYSGLLCSNGTCASPCDNGVCAGGRTCNTASNPPACACPLGTVARDSQCVDVCSTITCSGRGTCVTQGQFPTCACESGYVPNDNGDCILPNCVPTTRATQLCLDSDVYWYDSCGAHEELAAECGSRGCESSACVPPHWENRDLDLGALSATEVDASFVITSDKRVIVAVADLDRLRFYVWQDGWRPYSADAPFSAPATPIIRVNGNDIPSVEFVAGGNGSNHLLTFAGCSWCSVGNSTFSSGFADLMLDAAGRPTVAVAYDNTATGRAFVLATFWDGAVWQRSGFPFVNYAGRARRPSAAFGADGTLFVAWHNDETGRSVVSQRRDETWSEFFSMTGIAAPMSVAIGPALMASAVLAERGAPFRATFVTVLEWTAGTPPAEPARSIFVTPNANGVVQSEPSLDVSKDGSARAVLAWSQNGGVSVRVRQQAQWGVITGGGAAAPADRPLARISRDLACVHWRDSSAPKNFKLSCATLD